MWRSTRLLLPLLAALSAGAACETDLGFRKPERPSRVSVAGVPRGLVVRFPALEDATEYVLRWTTAGGTAVRRLSCEAPPCTIDGLTPEIVHSVRVSTRDRVGESNPSAPVSARPLRGDEILLPHADWEYAPGNAGIAITGVGDIDGDGDGELVIGEPAAGDGENGRIRLFLGDRFGLEETPAREIVGPPDTRLGGALAPGGDVNEDGFADLVVGSPGANGNPGRVLLFRGGVSGLGSSPAWTGSVLQDDAKSGAAVASGDVNGDGLADLVAGAPAYAATGSTGRVELYLGPGPSSGALFPAAVSATGGGLNGGFGTSVALVDMDADGFDDLAAGAPFVDDAEVPEFANQGELHLHRWDPVGGTWEQGAVLEGDGEAALFGLSLANAGDTDGDGLQELLVGSPGHIGTFFAEGEAYLYEAGSAGLGATPIWTRTGEVDGASLGSSVIGAGDLNLDGYDDIAIGAPGASLAGRVHVFFGSPAGLAEERVFEGLEVGEGYGTVVAAAGDVNGDGFPDLACGASDGRVDVILGGRPASSPVVDAGPRIAGTAGSAVRASAATFLDEVQGVGYTCTWTWGDGTTDVIGDCRPGEVPAEHVFTEPGEYDVTLRVLGTDSRMGEAITGAVIQ